MARMEEKGEISVREAGRRGGRTVASKYGHEHFQEIGKMGGQKVKRLIQEGKESEAGSTRRMS